MTTIVTLSCFGISKVLLAALLMVLARKWLVHLMLPEMLVLMVPLSLEKSTKRRRQQQQHIG